MLKERTKERAKERGKRAGNEADDIAFYDATIQCICRFSERVITICATIAR